MKKGRRRKHQKRVNKYYGIHGRLQAFKQFSQNLDQFKQIIKFKTLYFAVQTALMNLKKQLSSINFIIKY